MSDNTQPLLPGNPFAIESPEKLSAEQIVQVFVPTYTRVEEAQQQKHTFIWGPRGSGKSMMLRFMEAPCQRVSAEGKGLSWSKNRTYFGVYCPCKEGQYNKTELTHILDRSASQILSEHLLNLSLLRNLVVALVQNLKPRGDLVRFARMAFRLFDPGAIVETRKQVDEMFSIEEDPLGWFLEVLDEETRCVSRFLRAVKPDGTYSLRYSGATTGYHDFLLPVVQLAQSEFIGGTIPIFFLVDDADRLSPAQSTIVNTWIANRDQRYMCFKVTANREAYGSFETRDGGIIEQPHDYSSLDVEELYTSSLTDFRRKMQLIADRRLALSSIPTKRIGEFLPASQSESGLLDEIKEELGREWDVNRGPGRKEDYLYRYATPRLFQRLGKTRKSYAGFENIVNLSSGIVRDFLEPIYLMVDHAVSEGQKVADLKAIPVDLQDRILRQYSEEFLLDKFADIRKALPPDQYDRLDKLSTLVESLGELFYARLHDPKASEPRLFSFTIRGDLDPEVEKVLRLGLRFRYFQVRTYSKKEGGGMEKWYILNRRVCPRFKLDPSGFSGRISLQAQLLSLACKDPTAFVRTRLGEPIDYDEMDLFDDVTKEQGP